MIRFPLASVLFACALIGAGMHGCSSEQPPDQPDPGWSAASTQPEAPRPAALAVPTLASFAASLAVSPPASLEVQPSLAAPVTHPPPGPASASDAGVFNAPDLQTSRPLDTGPILHMRQFPDGEPVGLAFGMLSMGLIGTRRPLRFGPVRVEDDDGEEEPGEDEEEEGEPETALRT